MKTKCKLIYKNIGLYKIKVYLGENNYLAGVFTQKVIPDILDINKFISQYNMVGYFDHNKIKTWSSILFSIQARDKYLNSVTTSILTDIKINLKNKQEVLATSFKDDPYKSNLEK